MSITINSTVLIIIIAIIFLMALIGYIADKKGIFSKNKNNNKRQETVVNQVNEIPASETWSDKAKPKDERQETIHKVQTLEDWASIPDSEGIKTVILENPNLDEPMFPDIKPTDLEASSSEVTKGQTSQEIPNTLNLVTEKDTTSEIDNTMSETNLVSEPASQIQSWGDSTQPQTPAIEETNIQNKTNIQDPVLNSSVSNNVTQPPVAETKPVSNPVGQIQNWGDSTQPQTPAIKETNIQNKTNTQDPVLNSSVSNNVVQPPVAETNLVSEPAGQMQNLSDNTPTNSISSGSIWS